MISRTFVVAMMLWAVVGPFVTAAQPAAPPLPDIQTLGPQVGSAVPDFTLQDQHGQPRTLESLMGPQGLMLVFHRSADWCPYCKTQLAELQQRSAELARRGIGVAAISYDSVEILADFSQRRGITFPLLSDAGSATIKRFGIFNTTVPESNRQSYGVPFPGTFMLNRQGVVTSRYFEQAYQERTTVGSIMTRLGNDVEVQAATVSSPQLEMSSFSTDSVVAPGTVFSLVFDVRPSPGIHVYAPGVTGYRPIALAVQPQPGLIIRDAHYPASETYHFKPLDEHVEVYQRPFRIVQDLVIDASQASQAALRNQTSMTIDAVLTYQACDDKICYNPQTVPLSWTVQLRGLDRERALQAPR